MASCTGPVELAQVELAQVELAQVELAQVELAQVELAQVELAQVVTRRAGRGACYLVNVALQRPGGARSRRGAAPGHCALQHGPRLPDPDAWLARVMLGPRPPVFGPPSGLRRL
jgi:hypothetical protein